MKILVVGGAGFIGSHVVDLYIKEGHEVVIIDDLSKGKKQNVNPKAKFVPLNICTDQLALRELFQTEKFEIVNHHAAQKSVPNSIKDPVTDADINIIGTLNLLQNAVKYCVKKFIFSSSGGALAGDIGKMPTTEEDEPRLMTPYAISKYSIENYLSFYHQRYGLTFTVLRYANVYGPRQHADGESGVVAIFLQNLMEDKKSTIYISKGMTQGATRDYIFVKDVALANRSVLNKGDNQIFNIGTGIETTTESIYRILETQLNKNIPIIRKLDNTGALNRVSLDCTRAKEILGWEYKTDLNTGLQKTIESINSLRNHI